MYSLFLNTLININQHRQALYILLIRIQYITAIVLTTISNPSHFLIILASVIADSSAKTLISRGGRIMGYFFYFVLVNKDIAPEVFFY